MSRSSAIESAIDQLGPQWGDVHGMRVPLHFGDPESERRQLQTLALADVSVLPKVGVKGPGAEAFVSEEGIPVPEDVYDSARLSDGGWIVRVDRDEFFVEEGPEGGTVAALRSVLASDKPGVYRIERQETGLLLCGTQAVDVLRQTCGYPFEVEPGSDTEFVYTRVAAISASVLRHTFAGVPAYRIWCVPSSGRYLWEEVHQICSDLGGTAVGLSSLQSLL